MFPKNSNLNDSGIPLPAFLSNLKLYNISVTRKMVMNLDLWKVPGPDCILVLVFKNCELELSYI